MNLLTIAYLPHAKQHAAWRKEMKAMRKQLQTTTEAITGSFAEANSNQVLGIGNIVAKVAAQRVENEAKVKAATSQRLATSSWTVWDNKPLETKFDVGGSSIDLASNTLTLSDGTVIDLTTGLKKINLTV